MGINYERLYDYRFQDVDQQRRRMVWSEIARFVHERMGQPQCVLDPAGGRGEFIEAVPATERWLIDAVEQGDDLDPTIRTIIDDVQNVQLPADYFDGIFVSNFLEHLGSQEGIADFLGQMYRSSQGGGRIAVMGPNFRYCFREYFDCADHVVALTHVAVAEHLHAAGFAIKSVVPRFLPYSFRGLLPPSAKLTRRYLRTPVAWRVLGKQFLVLAEKPKS